MPLAFLLDENLRGPVWYALRRRATDPTTPLDVLRVGDRDDLPLGMTDLDILNWCDRNERILVSMVFVTMPKHVEAHLSNGRHVPGVVLVRAGFSIRTLVDVLALIAHAGRADEYRDQIRYVP